MAIFKIRFYGRFVFAAPRNGNGSVRALAIDPYFVPELGADRHRLLLTAPRASVGAGTRRPNLGVMPSFDVAPHFLEQAVWDLDGCDVRLPTAGSLTWGDKRLLPDLSHLTNQTGIFDAELPYVTSVIDVPSGRLVAKRLNPGRGYDFVPVSAPRGGGQFATDGLADVVELELDVEGDLQLDVAPRTRIPSASQAIVIEGSDRGPVTLSVSYMCAAGSHLEFDKEFAALYLALKNPPKVADRLVPRAAPVFLETPCLVPALIEY